MSKQSAGDASIVVSAGGAVTVTNGLTVSETKEMFRLMLSEAMAGIQAEAMKVAQDRNERLLDDFLVKAQEKFGEKVDEKLNEFRDPGAQLAFRHAQLEYCKYGDEDAEQDAIELLIARLSEVDVVSEKIIVDEAIKICGRLTKRQMDLACFFLSIYSVYFGGVANYKKFSEIIIGASKYIDGIFATQSELAMMEHVGVLSLHPQGAHWKPLSEVLLGSYAGMLFKGHSKDYFNLPNLLERGLIVRHVRNPLLFQPSDISLSSWEEKLKAAGYGSDEIAAAMAAARDNLLPSEEVFDQIAEIAPAYSSIREIVQGQDAQVLSYNLTPIGKAVAIARTRRDGFRPDLRLAQII